MLYLAPNIENQEITIREAVSEQDRETFWTQLRIYQKRDIYRTPDGRFLDYFPSDDRYRDFIRSEEKMAKNRCNFLFFSKNGQEIGFALLLISNAERGNCFIHEFCIYPEYRDRGLGTQCVRRLLDWAFQHGADYAELHYGKDTRRMRFWQNVGFINNGVDEWGHPLMLRPPKNAVPVSVELLTEAVYWPLLRLENSFRAAIGEETLYPTQLMQLWQAVLDDKLHVFLACRNDRPVGMCSVTKCYSTLFYADTGVFGDFFIEPAFRRQGIARMLAQAAQSWSLEQGLARLTVCCSPHNEKMFQALGFEVCLGNTYAKQLIESI